MAQQTAVEWLVKYIERENWSLPQDIEEMAVQMEKEQIENAYKNGSVDSYWKDSYWNKSNVSPEQYYNETYKNK